MKPYMLAAFLLSLWLSAGAQSFDSLRTIGRTYPVVSNAVTLGLIGSEYDYGGLPLTNAEALRPYFAATGSTTLLRQYDGSLRGRRMGRILTLSGVAVASAGAVIYVGSAMTFVTGLFLIDRRVGDLVWFGIQAARPIMVAGGSAVLLGQVFWLFSSYRLNRSIRQFNHGRQPRVRWDISASPVPGAGVRLAGTF